MCRQWIICRLKSEYEKIKQLSSQKEAKAQGQDMKEPNATTTQFPLLMNYDDVCKASSSVEKTSTEKDVPNNLGNNWIILILNFEYFYQWIFF